MWNIIAAFVLSLLSVVGAAALIKWTVNMIFRPKKLKATVIINTEDLSEDEIEYTLRSIAMRIIYNKGLNTPEIIVDETNLTETGKKICRKLYDDFSFIKGMNKKEISELILTDN